MALTIADVSPTSSRPLHRSKAGLHIDAGRVYNLRSLRMTDKRPASDEALSITAVMTHRGNLTNMRMTSSIAAGHGAIAKLTGETIGFSGTG
nr:hypothetical protein CFP56_55019 [Quercus suber]